MKVTLSAFGVAALAVAVAVIAACPTRTPPDIPQAKQAAEIPAPITAPAAEIVPIDPPPILRAPPGTPGGTVSAPAPKVAASKAKPAPKTGKAGQPKVTEEAYAEAQAAFYAQHVACLREVLDVKIAMDVAVGKIRDFGNIRESSVCGYDYFDPATGRLPPYSK